MEQLRIDGGADPVWTRDVRLGSVDPRRSVWDIRVKDGRRRIEGEQERPGANTHTGDRKHARSSVPCPDAIIAAALKWIPAGGLVVDPFAGGGTRGAVLTTLNYRYVGVEICPAQARAACATIRAHGDPAHGLVVCGDALELPLGRADAVLTCPPYWWLERYQRGPRDLSMLSWSGYLAATREWISRSVMLLRPGGRILITVGDMRHDGRLYPIAHHHTHAVLQVADLLDVVVLRSVGLGGPYHAARLARADRGSTTAREHEYLIVGERPTPPDAPESAAPAPGGQ